MLASFKNASKSMRIGTPGRRMASNVRFPGPNASRISDPPHPSGTSGDSSTGSGPSPSLSTEHTDLSISSSLVPIRALPSGPPPGSEAQSHPYAGAKEYAENQEARNAAGPSNLPALPQDGLKGKAAPTHSYALPPFDTHHFFAELEKTFAAPTAHSLMRATRALIVDRIGRVKREALNSKDLENQAYLFRAALSEARNEITLRQRNDSAALKTSLAALRRELDVLDGRMKSDIANLKHELQMDVDNRKTESKTDLKQMDIAIEDVLNKAIIGIGDLRATTEQMKWENMYRSVLALGVFAVSIVVVFELSHQKSSKTKPPATASAATPASPIQQNMLLDGVEEQMT